MNYMCLVTDDNSGWSIIDSPNSSANMIDEREVEARADKIIEKTLQKRSIESKIKYLKEGLRPHVKDEIIRPGGTIRYGAANERKTINSKKLLKYLKKKGWSEADIEKMLQACEKTAHIRECLRVFIPAK